MVLTLKRPPRFAARQFRRGVQFPAAILLADDRVLGVTVRNLSSSGFMALCPAPLDDGQWIGIDLPGFGIARAVVRWSEHGEVGCEFRHPIAVEKCAGEIVVATARPSLAWPYRC